MNRIARASYRLMVVWKVHFFFFLHLKVPRNPDSVVSKNHVLHRNRYMVVGRRPGLCGGYCAQRFN